MEIIYTDQAKDSLDDLSHYLIEKQGWSLEKFLQLRRKILDKAENLRSTHSHFQKEEYLEHLGKGHRRAIEGYFKIIYRVEEDKIFITDVFDTRQDPNKMKG
jgi:plasmid stabilization system protein ParE